MVPSAGGLGRARGRRSRSGCRRRSVAPTGVSANNVEMGVSGTSVRVGPSGLRLGSIKEITVHILTKVFVLFAAILSVLMAALAISYTANADRISRDYRHAVAAKEAAEEAMASAESIYQRALENKSNEAEGLRQQIAERDKTLRELEAENSQLAVELRRAKNEAELISGRIAQFGVSLETQANIIDSYRDELQGLRMAELRWQDEKIDISDKLSDLESQVLVYEQTQRSLREQLAAAQRELDAMRSGGSVASSASTTIPVELSGPMVRGRVTGTSRSSNGETLIEVSLGQRDRVRNNTKLYLVRSGRYLGEMVVEESDVNWSVGKLLNTAGSGITIRQNDEVRSRLD